MNKKINILISLFVVAAGAFAAYSIVAHAQSVSNIFYSYPIKELGNCKDEADCRVFCDDPANINACITFAQNHNLISKEEARKTIALSQVSNGPGGCKDLKECQDFCDNPANINVCLSFAQKNNLISQSDLKQAEQFAQAINSGITPPGNCKNKQECETYCSDPAHINECIDFGQKSGFMSQDDAREARQVAKAINSGITPPGNCKTKDECKTYCSDPIHAAECLNFAQAAGFMSKDEAENAQKMITLMSSGQTPGNCKTKDECETYCSDAVHNQECANFALKNGLMKPEEAQVFKKTGGKGPGGCQGEIECKTFCNDPANQDICFKFAQENGFIPKEQIDQMKEGVKMMKEDASNMPPEISNCLESALGSDSFEKIQKGELMPGPQIGDTIKQCFQQINLNNQTMPNGNQMPNPMMSPITATGSPMMPNYRMMPNVSGTQIFPPMFNQQEDRPENFNNPGDFNDQIPGNMPSNINPEDLKNFYQDKNGQTPQNYQVMPRPYQQMMPPQTQGLPNNFNSQNFNPQSAPQNNFQNNFSAPATNNVQQFPNNQFYPPYQGQGQKYPMMQQYPYQAPSSMPPQNFAPSQSPVPYNSQMMPQTMPIQNPTTMPSGSISPESAPITPAQTMPNLLMIFLDVFKGILW